MDSKITELCRQLEKKLSPLKYEHTISTAYTAMSLAMRYDADLKKAELAGLLHDCAKQYSDGEILIKCGKKNLHITDDERQAPMVLHAKYGAWMAEHKYRIQDGEILSAIRFHTTGKVRMSLMDKLIYVADFIEPRRYKAENLQMIRRLAFTNLDQALLCIMKDTIRYLEDKGSFIDQMSLDAYEYYRLL